jgi:hypothetical protein
MRVFFVEDQKKLMDDGQTARAGGSSKLQRITAGMKVVEERDLAGNCVALLQNDAFKRVKTRNLQASSPEVTLPSK